MQNTHTDFYRVRSYFLLRFRSGSATYPVFSFPKDSEIWRRLYVTLPSFSDLLLYFCFTDRLPTLFQVLQVCTFSCWLRCYCSSTTLSPLFSISVTQRPEDFFGTHARPLSDSLAFLGFQFLSPLTCCPGIQVDPTAQKQRKSVAFSEGAVIMDTNGEVTQQLEKPVEETGAESQTGADSPDLDSPLFGHSILTPQKSRQGCRRSNRPLQGPLKKEEDQEAQRGRSRRRRWLRSRPRRGRRIRPLSSEEEEEEAQEGRRRRL